MNISSIADNTNSQGNPLNDYGHYVAYFKNKMDGQKFCVLSPSTWGGASEHACTVSVRTTEVNPGGEFFFLGCITSYINITWAGSDNVEACVFGELA